MDNNKEILKIKTARDSGIELLRIIIMFQIIFMHISAYGGLKPITAEIGGIDQGIFNVVWGLNRAGVNVFVIIAGYFMCNKESDLHQSLQRAMKVWRPALFYGITISLIFWLFSPAIKDSVSGLQWLIPLFPVLSKNWFFISLYVVLVFIHPYLNKAVMNLTKKEYLTLLGILFFLFAIWTSLAKLAYFEDFIKTTKIFETLNGRSIYSFVLLYYIGGYIQQFIKPHRIPQLKYVLAYFALCFIDTGIDEVAQRIGVESYSNVYGMFDNPFVIFETICLFMIFRDLHIKSKIINLIGGSVMGIYMIHEHPYMRDWIWSHTGSQNADFYTSIYPIKIIIVMICIFAGCAAIEIIRQKGTKIIITGSKKIKKA